jgi:RNA polymerase sigma factor (sigma-70 family)
MATNKTAQSEYELIYEREVLPFIDAVYTFAVRLNNNDRNSAADLLQETFLKAWKAIKRGRYAEGTNPKAWLFSICKNTFINEYRTKKRKPNCIDLDSVSKTHQQDNQNNNEHLYEDPGTYQMGDEVTAAINALKPTFRVPLLLSLEDFSYEEIAEMLNVPIGTVRSRLHRAKKQMEEQLETYAKSQGFRSNDDDIVSGKAVKPNASIQKKK